MDYYKRSMALTDETVSHRRYLHANAEVGLKLPKTKAYVAEKLQEIGITPVECGEGLVATIGNGGKTFLLRADMDALPMCEESGLPFACPTKTSAHCCGHDMHAAMLLTAAKMLKENEAALEGTVKLMFQPAEETFEGCRNMIDHGVLNDPSVDAALAFHVIAGHTPSNVVMCCTPNETGASGGSVDGFRITVKGRSCHGAMPHMGADPINILFYIYGALQTLIARECNPVRAAVITVGQVHAGQAPNIIPDKAEMLGTLRTMDPATQQLLKKRMVEVAERTAAVYNGEAYVEFMYSVPPLVCDQELTEDVLTYIQQLPEMTSTKMGGSMGAEDFSLMSSMVPTTVISINAGFQDHRGDYFAHNSKVQFNEDVLSHGPACYAHCATEWLKNHR